MKQMYSSVELEILLMHYFLKLILTVNYFILVTFSQ